MVAGPVFAQIAQEALPYLGIGPSTGSVGQKKIAKRHFLGPKSSVPKAWRWWVEDPKLAANQAKAVVPNLVGLTLSQALQKSRAKKLRMNVSGAGIVSFQTPEAGRLVPLDSPIQVDLKRPASYGETHDPTP